MNDIGVDDFVGMLISVLLMVVIIAVAVVVVASISTGGVLP